MPGVIVQWYMYVRFHIPGQSPDYDVCSERRRVTPALIRQQVRFQNQASPSGNRTPVSRVTGGDTYHYTNEDLLPW